MRPHLTLAGTAALVVLCLFTSHTPAVLAGGPVPAVTTGVTIYVDDDAPNDPGPNDPNVSDPMEDGSEFNPFDSIQEALDRAFPADTVQVLPGDFHEDLEVKHDGVTLRGSGRGVTRVGSPGSLVLFAVTWLSSPGLAMRVFLEGITFTRGSVLLNLDGGGLREIEILDGDLGVSGNPFPEIYGESIDILVDSVTLARGAVGFGYCNDALTTYRVSRLVAPSSAMSFHGCAAGVGTLSLTDSTVATIYACGGNVNVCGLEVKRSRFTGSGIYAGTSGGHGGVGVAQSIFEDGGIRIEVGGSIQTDYTTDFSGVSGCKFLKAGIEYVVYFSSNSTSEEVFLLEIESNRFHERGVTATVWGDGHGTASSKVRIANNVLASPLAGITADYRMRDASFGTRPQELRLEAVNNTFHDARKGIWFAVSDHVSGMDSLAALIQNNIVSGGEVGLEVIGNDDLSLSLIANDVFGQSVAGYQGDVGDPTGLDGNISSDPLFADAAAGDFTLKPSSPCVDAGRSGPEVPAHDHDGVARPQDGDGDGMALPDIGAFEFVIRDADGDGFPAGADCDEHDPSIHPTAPDLPGNAIDEDCDGALACDPSAPWRTHGRFVQCVARECGSLVRGGQVDAATCDALIAHAARSRVGRGPRRWSSAPLASP